MSKVVYSLGEVMKGKVRYIFIVVVFFALFGCTGGEKKKTWGRITFIKGKVFIKNSPTDTKWKMARIDYLLDSSNVIMTGKNSLCDIKVAKGIVRIKEKSLIKFDDINKRRASIEQRFGNVMVKLKKLIKGEEFNIKTATVSIGVRGTEFMVRVSLKNGIVSTDVMVNKGKVLARRKVGDIKVPDKLKKMVEVEVKKGEKLEASGIENKRLILAIKKINEGKGVDIKELNKKISVPKPLTEKEKKQFIEFEDIKLSLDYEYKGYGALVVLGGEGTKIYIDSEYYGDVSVSCNIKAGVHRVIVKRGHKVLKDKKVEVLEGQNMILEVEQIKPNFEDLSYEKVIRGYIRKADELEKEILKEEEIRKKRSGTKKYKRGYKATDRGKDELEDVIGE